MARRIPAISRCSISAFYLVTVTFLLTMTNAASAVAQDGMEAGAGHQRVVSINACTDQLLFALADRDQIAALTTYAANPAFSLWPEEIRASNISLIRGAAEEVLKLKPELVLAGRFTRRATRQRLRAFDIPLEVFKPAETVEDAKRDIRRVAAILGTEARGEALVAEIDAALAEARAIVQKRGLRLLQFQRRAYISGAGTLFDDVLGALGLENAATEAGLRGVRRTSLEAVLKLRPDALVVFDLSGRPTDQGAALLFHPALWEMYPPDRRLVIPGNLVVCGGPSLPMLLRRLARGVAGLDAERAQ